MYAISPTATFGEPVLRSTGKPAARIDETNKETQSFTPFPTTGNVYTVNLASSAKEVYLHNFMDLGLAARKNPYACDLSVLEDEFQNRSMVWYSLPFRIKCAGYEKSTCLLLWTILRRRGHFLQI